MEEPYHVFNHWLKNISRNSSYSSQKFLFTFRSKTIWQTYIITQNNLWRLESLQEISVIVYFVWIKMSGLNKILLPVLRFTGRVHCRSAIKEESRRKVLDLKTLFPRYVNTIQICKQYSTNHVSRGSDGATEASNTIYPECKF